MRRSRDVKETDTRNREHGTGAAGEWSSSILIKIHTAFPVSGYSPSPRSAVAFNVGNFQRYQVVSERWFLQAIFHPSVYKLNKLSVFICSTQITFSAHYLM
jgi:hypothetical protein